MKIKNYSVVLSFVNTFRFGVSAIPFFFFVATLNSMQKICKFVIVCVFRHIRLCINQFVELQMCNGTTLQSVFV